MRKIYWLTVLLSAIALAASAQTTQSTAKKKASTAAPKSAPAAKGPARSTAAKAPASRPAASKAAVSKSAAAKKGVTAKRKAPPGPVRQTVPTPDRYREIQQALIDKGYLKSEATGQWDEQSTDALRQFQTDQKLNPTGKITAMSLIGLGLGPKTADAPAVTPPVQPQTPLPDAH